VVRDAAVLAADLRLTASECAVLTVAAGAHDAEVMTKLLARDPPYGTGAARRRWEAAARANIARELESLTAAPPQ
jgi:predicted metal-dependent HD superfamily phosphohydrolase